MKFTIVVYAAPSAGQAAGSALRFVRASLQAGHDIYRLFFFGEGVHNANRLAIAAQDEVDLAAEWQQLVEEHRLDAVVCVTSAIRRGILDAGEADRYELDAVSLRPGFEIAGLGQLIDAITQSDRVINFG